MSEFSKGPWRGYRTFVGSSHAEYTIADFNGLNDEQDANIRLISAAPDMYEALTVMTSLVRLKYGNLDKEVEVEINKALAALAKADGKGE